MRPQEELLESLQNLTFADFMEMKKRWLHNLDFIWLIEGHLTEADALKLVQITEDSIKFSRISFESVPFQRTLCLRERTVYNYKHVNADPNNPNCYYRATFQYDKEGDQLAWANFFVLMSLLKEPIFKQLRTVEQLGYVVHSGIQKVHNVLHAAIGIQSSTKDPDFLESRVNSILLDLKENWPFKHEDALKIVNAKINSLRQEKTSLAKEFSGHWVHITNDNMDFDNRERKIDQLGQVTIKQVRSLFDLIFFERNRRLNYKACRPQDLPNKDAIQEINSFYRSHHFQMPGQPGIAIEEIVSMNLFHSEHSLFKIK
jgi:insulysin